MGSAREEIRRIADAIARLAAEPHPVLDLAARWLEARAPEPRRRVLVHGDYRVGNVMFDATGVRAILDWELAHLGDPVEDLGWYDPFAGERDKSFQLDAERAKYWLSVGAKPSDTVRSFLKLRGIR